MAYAATTKPSLYNNTKLYTGTGSSNAQTGIGFQPDWLWIKRRDATANHRMVNAPGGSSYLHSSSTNAVGADSSYISSFDSDGFTVGTAANTNANGGTYVGWCWKANGAGSNNTDGSITTTVSADTARGFSIVKWTGTSNADIGHGLGGKPEFILTKSISNANGFVGWHKNLTGGNEDDRYIYLSSTGAQGTTNNYWAGSNGITTTTFGVENNNYDNNIGTMVGYCFRSIKGYSKIGTYTGNGNADGPFIYTGFKPGWLMIKNLTDAGTSWVMHDKLRDPDNICENNVDAENNTSEANTQRLDILSNGFKNMSSLGFNNTSNETYLYLTFAEEPLVANVGTNGVPATAR